MFFKPQCLPNPPQQQRQILFTQDAKKDLGESFLYISQSTGIYIPYLDLGQVYLTSCIERTEEAHMESKDGFSWDLMREKEQGLAHLLT